MEQELVEQLAETSARLDMLDFYLNDLLGGVILTLVLLMAVRFVIRALAVSWFGNRNGSLISSVAEALAIIMALGLAYKTPGAVTTVFTWSAAVFKQLILS